MTSWRSGLHSVHRGPCHLLQLLLLGLASCIFFPRERKLHVHHLCDAFAFAFYTIFIWHHRFCGCRPLKTVCPEQIIFDKLKAPWSHLHEGGEKNQTPNWSFLFLLVDDEDSVLFREQKESTGLEERERCGVCVCMYFLPHGSVPSGSILGL